MIPEEVLDTKEKRLRNRSIIEHLVKWKGLPLEDATWEGAHILEHPNLHCLRTRNIWEGGLVMSPFQIINKILTFAKVGRLKK